MFDFDTLNSTARPNTAAVCFSSGPRPLVIRPSVLAEPRSHPHSPRGRPVRRRRVRGGREPVLRERSAVHRGPPSGGGGASERAEGRDERPRGGVREPREAGAAVAGQHAAVARGRVLAARQGEGGAGAEAGERAPAARDQERGGEAAAAAGRHGAAA